MGTKETCSVCRCTLSHDSVLTTSLTIRRFQCKSGLVLVISHKSDTFTNQMTAGEEGSRDVNYFTRPDFMEATRLMEINLQLTTPDKLKTKRARAAELRRQDEQDPFKDKYPPLYFSGVSTGGDGMVSEIEGSVRMGSDMIPRWDLVRLHLSSAKIIVLIPRKMSLIEADPRWR
jgi:hypothetical protein